MFVGKLLTSLRTAFQRLEARVDARVAALRAANPKLENARWLPKNLLEERESIRPTVIVPQATPEVPRWPHAAVGNPRRATHPTKRRRKRG